MSNRLSEMKTRLHRTFGPGLVGLYDPYSKKLNKSNMKKHWIVGANNIQPFNTDQYPDYYLDAEAMSSFVLGWVVGLQYNEEAPSDCFYSVADTITSLDYFVKDWNNLINFYQYYPLFIYDPIHFYGNLMAVYE